MVRASGLGEVWTHGHDDLKFTQFGWRCTNKENSYSNETLIGNWNESRFDIEKQKNAKRLPSQHDHYFNTTYNQGYNSKRQEVPKELVHLKCRHPHAHPGHQPELDSPEDKMVYNSWETTSRAAYVHPQLQSTVQSAAPQEPPQQS